MRENGLPREYRRRFDGGREMLAAELWRGEYYIQRYDAGEAPRLQHGTGCLTDQLIGQ